MSISKFQCCFCGKSIENEHINESCSLIAIANWNKVQSSQQEQQMFCHISCLKDKVDDNFPLYIEDLVD